VVAGSDGSGTAGPGALPLTLARREERKEEGADGMRSEAGPGDG
jgi:hypothetical protein